MNIVKFANFLILNIVTFIGIGTFAGTGNMITFVQLLVLIAAVEKRVTNSTSINFLSLA